MLFYITNIANYLPLIFAKTAEECGSSKLFGIIPSWYHYLTFNDACNINLNIGDNPEELALIGLAAIEILLRICGFVALAYVIYGGFKFVTSNGDAEGIKNARNTVQNALIGVIITTLASTIVVYIAGRF